MTDGRHVIEQWKQHYNEHHNDAESADMEVQANANERNDYVTIEYCPVKFWYNPFRFCISLIRYQAIFVTDYSLIHLKSNLLCSSEFTDFDSRYFWNWTDFQSYLDFMLVVWVVGAAITYLMLSVTWFMETVGFLAVFTEAMLGAPQFLRNYRNKSTHGMSICMVIMWTAGDMFKTGYFILRNAPTQFWICGTLQVS
ncbi:solute carrier family 66 member 2 [Aedes albopictus]|uniref:Uncharacterized protein n=1 Tax=Aedes albopictus TaxID=7160 RepID=A0ABM1YMJ1_AEDAL